MTTADAIKLAESKTELATYLCYTFTSTALYELRRWFAPDDERFLAFVLTFVGSRLSITQKRLAKTIWRYRLGTAYRRFNRLYKLKRFEEGRQAERDFLRLAKLPERPTAKAYDRRIAEARKALANVLRAERWIDGLRSLEKKQFIRDGDLDDLGLAHVVYHDKAGK